MEHVRILAAHYLDQNDQPIIGGVESYISALCEVVSESGSTVIVYQFGSHNHELTLQTRQGKPYRVVCIENGSDAKKLLSYLDRHEHPDYQRDILIFATDYFLKKSKFRRTIAIQHGIAWDITADSPVSGMRNLSRILKGAMRAVKKYWSFRACETIVCVDYNFLNWYRTQVAHVDQRVVVIPNFARLPASEARLRSEKDEAERKRVKIIFARRLIDYRGTRLFTNVICSLMKQTPELSVTVAGVGPDEGWMRERLEPLGVSFTVFRAEDSIRVHSDFDIAVVPTKGSEGTSLSLLEAMSAGCAVIASNVGGMTNILLDGFNGLLIEPTEEQLSLALRRLIEDEKLRNRLSKNARATVETCFSYDIWKERWIKLLGSV